MEDLRFAITLISVGFPLIPLFFGLLRFQRLDGGMRLLLILLAVTVAFDGAGLYWAIVLIEPNAWIFNYLPPLEFTLVALIFYSWHDNEIFKKLFLIAIPVFFVFWAVALVLGNLDSAVLTVESVVVVVLAVATMFIALNRDQIPVLKNPIFWVSSALVVYFAGNLFLFTLFPTFLKNLAEDLETMRNIWILHSLLNLIKNLLFLGGILACRTRSSSSSAAPLSS